MYEVASLVNDRPIGRHPTETDEEVYLSPNDLLLGRTGQRIPAGPFNLTTNKYVRHRLMQKIGDTFWRRWTEDFFPSLMIQQKWHVRNRDLKVGDIVMIQQDSGKVKGRWRLGRIVKAEPSNRDGLVRQVQVEYRNPESKSAINVMRAVQRVVVVSPVEHDEDYDEYLKNALNSK